MQAQQITDSCRPPAAQHPDFDDAALSTHRRTTRTAMRPTRTVCHPSGAKFSITTCPASCGGHRDLKPLSGSAQRPTFLDDTSSQPQATGFLQRGITVDHEDLLVVSAFLRQLAL